MRRIYVSLLVAIIVLTLSLSLVACNNNNDDTMPQTPSHPEGELSNEMMDKVNAIYSKASIEPQTIDTVQQLATITSINYSRGTGPITVTPATLDGEEITLITLSGTEFKEGQATTIKESQLASMGKSNDYLTAVVKLFKNNTVPRNKPIIVTGISLGGMIAQQLLSQPYIMRHYDIRAVVTYGSPVTLPFNRKGVRVVRFTDVNDMVPKAGEAGIYNSGGKIEDIKAGIIKADANEKILESSKYSGAIETHALSYIEDECWDKYDILGYTDRRHTLITTAPLTFYEAPILTK